MEEAFAQLNAALVAIREECQDLRDHMRLYEGEVASLRYVIPKAESDSLARKAARKMALWLDYNEEGNYITCVTALGRAYETTAGLIILVRHDRRVFVETKV